MRVSVTATNCTTHAINRRRDAEHRYNPVAVDRLPQPHTTFDSGKSTLRFYLGDCLDILSRLPPGSLDAIVTSPPYNLGIRYRSYDDTMPRDEYLKWTGEWVARAATALAPGGSMFLQRRRQAVRSLDGDRRRPGRASTSEAAEHHPLDQVDRHREGGRG